MVGGRPSQLRSKGSKENQEYILCSAIVVYRLGKGTGSMRTHFQVPPTAETRTIDVFPGEAQMSDILNPANPSPPQAPTDS